MQLIELFNEYNTSSIFRRFDDGESYANLEGWLKGKNHTIDQNLKDFISICLEMNFERRASIEDLFQHPFIEPEIDHL